MSIPLSIQLRRVLFGCFALVALYIGGILAWGTIVDFKPEAVIPLDSDTQAAKNVVTDSVLTLAIWNLGYAGLGAEADFFFDNGGLFASGKNMVRPPKALSEKYQKGIEEWIDTAQADIFLLQEVDKRAKRSHYMPQFDRLSALKPDYAHFFAVNYSSPWVPIPIFQPWKAYGSVESGLATFSKYQPVKSTRFQLPGKFDWPMRIFQLDRCVAEHRLALPNGRELIIYNVHNSAHDKDGALKREEMAFLRKLFLQEYEKGNYVIAGGDWNQCPPGIEFDIYMPGRSQGYHQITIESEFMPLSWQWQYDLSTPSNRKTRTPYRPGESFVTLIDFFLISPNIMVKKVDCADLEFKYSDHQPVKMTVQLIGYSAR